MGPAPQIEPDRRAEARMLCSELVTVQWVDSAGRDCMATAVLEDISPSGACLQFEVAVSEGTQLSIAVPGMVLPGQARYCRFRDAGYFTGVRFDGDCQWSAARYRPQHLLDPRSLGGAPRPPR